MKPTDLKRLEVLEQRMGTEKIRGALEAEIAVMDPNE
jgi:hypothetical protein